MDEKLKNQSVQTYVEDMTKALESNKEGIIKKLIHEQEQHDAEKKNLSPESKKNKIFMFVGIVLFVLGLATLAYFIVFKEDIHTVDVGAQFKPIIFTDETGFVEIGELTKDKIAGSVRGELNASQIKAGQVEGIYLTENKKIIGLRKFISLIKGSFAPGENIYVDDNFLMGVTNKGTKNLFFLLKVRSFADTFPLMRNWEEKMFYDLHGFFGMELDVSTNYLLTKPFEDGVMQNKNTRILYDNDNNIVMLYLFADENSVILADSEPSASEVMLRLASGEVKK